MIHYHLVIGELMKKYYNMISLTLVLYNIRSVHNVGSFFRTADGAGVKKIIIIGHTPTPIDRFGRQRTDMHKVALGAELLVPWEYFKTWEEAYSLLRANGAKIIAVEQDTRSILYTEPAGRQTKECMDKVAIILGPEVEGLPEEILSNADTIVEIPMYGQKESLNVAVAGGIVMYGIRTHF